MTTKPEEQLILYDYLNNLVKELHEIRLRLEQLAEQGLYIYSDDMHITTYELRTGKNY